jgi:tetratricopeptide (TPR) repeat protein
MRTTLLVTLLALGAPHAGAQPAVEFPALKQRLLRGNYAEALAGFEEQAKGDKPPVAALVGVAECKRATGDTTGALDALAAALKAHPDSADLLARRADLYYALGKFDDATADAEAALKKNPDQLLARWALARVQRDKGNLSEADAETRKIVRAYTDAAAAEKDITDPELLLAVAEAGYDNAVAHGKHEQIQFILKEVLRDALKANPDFWPAEALAGALLLEKHNRADAADAFDAALKINPKACDALVGKGTVAFERMEFGEAERLADVALKVNPKHPGALRLKADVRGAEADGPGAEKLLKVALAVNARDMRALGRLAALRHLSGDAPGFAALAKEALALDSKPAQFYTAAGTLLSDARQYAKAAECFERAGILRPALPGARAGLGLLYYMQGREAEARAALKAALKADPFNVKADNALTVLDELAEYATTETEHFVIRFDKKTDKVLAAFMAGVLEDTHAEYAKKYNFAPPGKVLVEIFARRQMFSGRIALLPGLPGAVQGACTGPLIALPSPRADGAARLYNWEVVARHELTHAFNLLQTQHRAPVWLTEGLAVRSEHTSRFTAALPLLRDRLAAGTAFDLDTITRAYKRFGQPQDVILAYYQGSLYIEYITKSYGGEPAVAKLLDAFQKTADVTGALKLALGAERADFEAGYRKFLQDAVNAAGGARKAEKPLTFAELEAAHKKDPEDADLSARLAAEYVRRDRADDAKKLAEAARAKEKGHPLACVVLARLARRAKDDAAAKAVLTEATDANPADGRVLLELGKLHFDAKDYEKAADAFEKGRTGAPGEADWADLLARTYGAWEKPEQLAGVIAEQALARPDDFALHLRLAKLWTNANKHAEAERAARTALHIDLTSADAKELLLSALAAQKKGAEVEAIRKKFE